MVLRDDNDAWWRTEVERRLNALEGAPQLGYQSITEGGIEIRQGGAVRIRLGIDANGRASLVFFEADGSELVRLGELPAGRDGIEVYDSAGVAKIRAGELQSGGYGLEAISGATAIALAALGFGPQFGVDDSVCTVTSTTFADPSSGSAGPAVNVTVGQTGRLLILGGAASVLNPGWFPRIAAALSGANSFNPANDDRFAYAGNSSPNASIQASYFGGRMFTGLTPGVTAVTMKYRSSTGTGVDIDNRVLMAFPL